MVLSIAVTSKTRKSAGGVSGITSTMKPSASIGIPPAEASESVDALGSWMSRVGSSRGRGSPPTSQSCCKATSCPCKTDPAVPLGWLKEARKCGIKQAKRTGQTRDAEFPLFFSVCQRCYVRLSLSEDRRVSRTCFRLRTWEFAWTHIHAVAHSICTNAVMPGLGT